MVTEADCDVLVERVGPGATGVTDSILLPTAGGPHAEAAAVARAISHTTEASVVERTVEESPDYDLTTIGATERGLLSRLVRGSLALDVVDDIECSVLLAEQARKRSLRERLFGIQ